ncbi:alcohol dehydrogenase catalytic domain-containing protein [Ornithinimicrobium pratense]|uniref:Alcohol dehydrogenase catalytic domain-containing protein n=1 Tax=Ornithinimicrobium pratense TaxID=2593973 RepID=A0A5J6V2G0_9MICO|nr:alcohol dehydrogenase catalytic domain-containing protein [Ornithinimicrobium pratense]QFG68090.1 alcohol dehydrogenase catalytic domain-containing protein [Ornithinimicrobium pratense]
MRALLFDAFGELPYVAEVAVPEPEPGGVVVAVEATGLCRSDWHAWQGHDDDIRDLPHVPGHEFAGVVHAVGAGVDQVVVGDRVVVPFVCGCGTCAVCRAGGSHVCPDQWQPGFNGPGSFAEYVAVPRADANVVPLPGQVSADVAAGLGCRFATAYRGVVDVARVREGERVVVLGCGGVGLAAVMVAAAQGAEVVAVDIAEAALELAVDAGATHTVDAAERDTVEAVRGLWPHGADVAVDALGSVQTARAATFTLRTHGRHLQIGLLPPAVVQDRATVPMHVVIARELRVLGSHGMPAVDYPRMLQDVATGRLTPERLISRRITLEEAPAALAAMDTGTTPGVTIIRP